MLKLKALQAQQNQKDAAAAASAAPAPADNANGAAAATTAPAASAVYFFSPEISFFLAQYLTVFQGAANVLSLRKADPKGGSKKKTSRQNAAELRVQKGKSLFISFA